MRWPEHAYRGSAYISTEQPAHLKSVDGRSSKTLSPGPLRLLLVALPFLLLAVTFPTAHAQSLASLPDGPLPSQPAQPFLSSMQQMPPSKPDSQSPPPRASSEAASPLEHAPVEERKWSQYVDPGERIPPLYPRDKWVFWIHQEVRVESAFPALLSAGFGQLTDSPNYGSDSEAFGDRLGAALLRQASMRFFCNSFFPVIVHEDPRYFRKASGSYKSRVGWAAERAFVIQHDNGSHGFNISDIFGHLAASALTPTYYPHPSANAGVVFETWGTSIAGDIGNNMFLEFWPDVTNLWRRHRQKAHAEQSPKG